MKRPRSLLDGFFSDDVDAVAQAARALRRPDELAAADVSHGRVYSTQVFVSKHTDAHGILSEQIFGPRQNLRCACGRVEGEANKDKACDRCGVLCADSSLRDWRFGHVQIPGAVHPLLIGAIARTLEIDPARVRAMVQPGDEGVDFADDESPRAGYQLVEEALRAAGANETIIDAAIVRRVPLPPPGDRPIIEPFAATMVHPWIGPVNEAWLELIGRANRHARLVELAAPAIISVGEALWVQLALERVIDLTRAPPQLLKTWSPPDVTTQPRLSGARDTPLEAVDDIEGLFFIDDESLLVHTARETRWVRLDGVVERVFPSCGRVAESIHGRFVVHGRAMRDFEPLDDNTELAVLDLETGTYCTSLPDEVRAFTFGGGEAPAVIDVRTGAWSRPGWMGTGDRSLLLAMTRDGRFGWLGDREEGGVVEMATAIPHVEPRVPPAPDRTALVLGPPPDEDTATAAALALTPDQQWRFLWPAGPGDPCIVSDATRALFAFTGSPSAAAFSPSADALAVAIDDEVVVLSVDRGQVRSRFTPPIG